MAGDPARVCRAPVAIVFFEIEHPLERRSHADHVAAMRVNDGLGLAGRARRVEHEERIFGIHHLGLATIAPGGGPRDGQAHQVVVPVVPAGLHGHVMPGAFEHDDVFHRAGALDGLVEDALQFHHLAVHVAAVAGDGHVRLAVLDPSVQRFHGEAAVDDRMNRADLGTGKHGDRQLRHAAHVDRYPIALLHPHAAQDVGELAYLPVERVVGEGAHVTVLSLPDQCQLVTPPCLHVPIQAVVHDVGLAAGKPLVEGRIGIIEHPIPLLEPGVLLRLRRPEPWQVTLRPLRHLVVARDVGVAHDICAGPDHVIRPITVRRAHGFSSDL